MFIDPAGVVCEHVTAAGDSNVPAQNGMDELPDLKSPGLPEKFQRSVFSPVPLIPFA
jgi:hypothetical protein